MTWNKELGSRKGMPVGGIKVGVPAGAFYPAAGREEDGEGT